MDSKNPYDNNQIWESEGRELKISFQKFPQKISKREISLDIRKSATKRNGPFDKNGNVQQGYFFPIPNDLEKEIKRLLKD